MKKTSIVLLWVYSIFFILSFGASAHGGDCMWLPFLLLAVLGSAIQWIEGSFKVRFIGFILVVLSISLAIGNVYALQSRQAKWLEKSVKAAFAAGECKGGLDAMSGTEPLNADGKQDSPVGRKAGFAPASAK